jgi:hypothetical protein
VKKYSILLLIVLVLAVGCQDKAAKIEEQPGQQKAAVDETAAGGFTGTALETIKADRYTYVQVDIGTERARWEIPWSFPRDWPCRTFTARLLSAILRWSTL